MVVPSTDCECRHSGNPETLVMRRLLVLLTMASMSVPASGALAEDVSTPPSGQVAPPPSSAGAAALSLPSACMKDFIPLREGAEKKYNLIKEAGDRNAPAEETCKLLHEYGRAEIKMIRYVETNAAGCEIPAGVAEQLKADYKNTEAHEKRVCRAAARTGARSLFAPFVGNDFGDPAFERSRRGR
jgi:hypothetical protein